MYIVYIKIYSLIVIFDMARRSYELYTFLFLFAAAQTTEIQTILFVFLLFIINARGKFSSTVKIVQCLIFFGQIHIRGLYGHFEVAARYFIFEIEILFSFKNYGLFFVFRSVIQ